MVRELGAPRRPVVRDVIPPDVDLAADALALQQVAELPRALERARRVLPLPLPADEQQAELPAQPFEVVAAEAPGIVEDRVVATGQPERQREQVGAPQREVDRVVRPKRAPARGDLRPAAAVVPHERRDLVEDPRVVAPAAVEEVDAVELDAARLEQGADRADHPLALELPRVAALRREREDGAPPVAVDDDRARVERDRPPAHRAQSCASSPARCGSKALRHATQSCPPATSCSGAPSACAMTRLLCTFSSSAPQVSSVAAAPRCLPTRRTVLTKRTMRPYRTKPDSWRSWRGTKKLPDWRNRPANEPGARCSACSIASAPRLAPMPTGRAAPSAGSTSSVSALA